MLRNEMEKQRVRVFAFNGKPGEPPNAEGWDARALGRPLWRFHVNYRARLSSSDHN